MLSLARIGAPAFAGASGLTTKLLRMRWVPMPVARMPTVTLRSVLRSNTCCAPANSEMIATVVDAPGQIANQVVADRRVVGAAEVRKIP